MREGVPRSKPVAYGDLVYLEGNLGKQGTSNADSLPTKGLLIADGLTSDECVFRSCAEYFEKQTNNESRFEERDRPFSRFPDDIEECMFEIVPQLRYRAHKEHRREMLKIQDREQDQHMLEHNDAMSMSAVESKVFFDVRVTGVEPAKKTEEWIRDTSRELEEIVAKELGMQSEGCVDVKILSNVWSMTGCSDCLPVGGRKGRVEELAEMTVCIAVLTDEPQPLKKRLGDVSGSIENIVRDGLRGGERVECRLEHDSIRVRAVDELSDDFEDGFLNRMTSLKMLSPSTLLGKEEERNELVEGENAIEHEFLRRLHLRMVDEQEQNLAHIAMQAGRPVKYGDVIQLRHVRSGKFLQMSKKASKTDQLGRMLVLDEVPDSPVGGVKSFFKLISKHTYYSEGENVYPGESIAVVSSKLSSYFLNVASETTAGSMHQRPVSFTPGADVDAQDEELVVTNWKLFIFREQHLRFQESLSSGTVIRLQHSLRNGYLMASERREVQKRSFSKAEKFSGEAEGADREPSSRGSLVPASPRSNSLKDAGIHLPVDDLRPSVEPSSSQPPTLGATGEFVRSRKTLNQLVPLPRLVTQTGDGLPPLGTPRQPSSSFDGLPLGTPRQPPSFGAHVPIDDMSFASQGTSKRHADEMPEEGERPPSPIFTAGRAQRDHRSNGRVDQEWSKEHPVTLLGHSVAVHSPDDHESRGKVEVSKSLWVIEEVYPGHSLLIDPKTKQYRLRHLNTNAYLGMVVGDEEKQLYLINMANQGAESSAKYVRCLWNLVPKKIQDSYKAGTFSMHLKLAGGPADEKAFLNVHSSGEGYGERLPVGLAEKESEEDVFTVEGVDPEYLVRAKEVGGKCRIVQQFIVDLLGTFARSDLEELASIEKDATLAEGMSHLEILRKTRVVPKWWSHIGREKEDDEDEGEGAHRRCGWPDHLTKVAENVITSLSQMVLFANKDDRVRTSEWQDTAMEAHETIPSGSDQQRQKLLGEVGLINLLHDLLALAFSKRDEIQAVLDKSEAGDQGPDVSLLRRVMRRLKWILKLVYKVVRHYCFENEINQMRLAKSGWIDNLIIEQLGQHLGEEETMMELVDNNVELLERYILMKDGNKRSKEEGTNTLGQCIKIIQERGLAASRSLAFLESISSCDGKPVIMNQNEIRKRLYQDNGDGKSMLMRIRFRQKIPSENDAGLGPAQNFSGRRGSIEDFVKRNQTFFGQELLSEDLEFRNYAVEVTWSMDAFQKKDGKVDSVWKPSNIYRSECEHEVLVDGGEGVLARSMQQQDLAKVNIKVAQWPPRDLDLVKKSEKVGEVYGHGQGQHQITIGRQCRSISSSKVLTTSAQDGMLEVEITVDIPFVHEDILVHQSNEEGSLENSSRVTENPQIAFAITRVDNSIGARGALRSWVGLESFFSAKSSRKHHHRTESKRDLGAKALASRKEEDEQGEHAEHVGEGPEVDLEVKDQVSLYLLEQIKLLAEICFGRNYGSIDALRPEYSLHLLLIILNNKGCKSLADLPDDGGDYIDDRIRAECAYLLKVLWIDVRPQKEVNLPFLTVPMNMSQLSSLQTVKKFLSKKTLQKEDSNLRAPAQASAASAEHGEVATSLIIKCRDHSVDDFLLLEVIAEEFLQSLKGRQDALNPSQTRLTTALLDVLECLVRFGYYQEVEKVKRIAQILVETLDGSSDEIKKKRNSKAVDRHERVTTQNLDTVSVMASKQIICKILLLFDNLALDYTFNEFMRRVDNKLGGKQGKSHPERSLTGSMEVRFEASAVGGEEMDDGFVQGDAAKLWSNNLDDVKGIEVNYEELKNRAQNIWGLSAHVKMLRGILPDLMLYDDAALQDLAFRLLIRDARRTANLLETIENSQVIDTNFSPDICNKWAKSTIERDGSDVVSIGVTSSKEVPASSKHGEAGGAVRSVASIMNVIGEILDEFESSNIRPDSQVDERLRDLLTLCQEGVSDAPVMREMFRDAGLFTMLNRAAKVTLFVEHGKHETVYGLDCAKKGRETLLVLLSLVAKCLVGSLNNQKATCGMFDTILGIARCFWDTELGEDRLLVECRWKFGTRDSAMTKSEGFMESSRMSLIEMADDLPSLQPQKSVSKDDPMHCDALDIVIAAMDVMFQALRSSRELARTHMTRERVKQLLDLAATFVWFVRKESELPERFMTAYRGVIDVLIQAACPKAGGFFVDPVEDIQLLVLNKGVMGRSGKILRGVLKDFSAGQGSAPAVALLKRNHSNLGGSHSIFAIRPEMGPNEKFIKGQLLDLCTACCVGNPSLADLRCKKHFSVQDIIDVVRVCSGESEHELKLVLLDFLQHVHLRPATHSALTPNKLKMIQSLTSNLIEMLAESADTLGDTFERSSSTEISTEIKQAWQAKVPSADICLSAILPVLFLLQSLYGQTTDQGIVEQQSIIDKADIIVKHLLGSQGAKARFPFDREKLKKVEKQLASGSEALSLVMNDRSKAPMLRRASTYDPGSMASLVNNKSAGAKEGHAKAAPKVSIAEAWDALAALMTGTNMVSKAAGLVRYDVESSAMMDFTKGLGMMLKKRHDVKQQIMSEWNECCNFLTRSIGAGDNEADIGGKKSVEQAMSFLGGGEEDVDSTISTLLRLIRSRIAQPTPEGIEMCDEAIQLLRRMIGMRIVDLIKKQESSKQDSRISHTEATVIAKAEENLKAWQFRIAKLGAPIIIAEILCNGEVQILHAPALLLGNRLLDMGNVNVQQLFLHAFKNKPRILESLQNIIRRGMDSATSAFKHNKGAKAGAMFADQMRDPFKIVIRFVQLLCEGHYDEMQNFMREQPGSEGNMNIVQDLMAYLAQIAKDRRRLLMMNPELLQQVLNTLTEVMQGPCTLNQEFLLKHDLHEFCAKIINMPLQEYEERGPPPVLKFVKLLDGWEQAGHGDVDLDHKIKIVSARSLDLLACKKAAVITVQALLEGSTSPALARRMRKGLDVQQMVRMLQEAAHEDDGDDDLKAMLGNLGQFALGAVLAAAGANDANSETGEADQEEALSAMNAEVMELVFTMLKSLDEMSPFLKEEITHFERHIGSRVSTSLWQHYSKTAGSVEILRGGKVEKYVFRYDPKWQPDVFQKVTSVQDLMSSILSTTRLDNPQKRLEELVDTTINMHFEVQHLQSVDNWRYIGPYLKSLRDHRSEILSLSFGLVVILNFVLVAAYFYKTEDLELEFPYYGRSGVELMSYNPMHQQIMYIPMLLSLILIPLYAASLLDYLCYKFPVKIHNRFRSKHSGGHQPMLPNLSIFEGRINIGLTASAKDDGSEFTGDGVLSPGRQAAESRGIRGLVESYVVDTSPKSGPWIFVILILTVLQIIMSAIREFGIDTTKRYSDLVDEVDVVVIAVFLTDLALRIWSQGQRFFFVLETAVGGKKKRKIQEFNIIDGVVVLIWASLMLSVKVGQAQLSSSVTTPLIWLRVARMIRAIIMMYKIGRLVLISGAAANVALNSMPRKSSTLAAVLLLLFHAATDFTILIFVMYIVTSLLGAVGMFQNVVLDMPFSTTFNPMWFAIGLVDMVRRLPTLPNVFNAITIRRRELMQTSALGLYFFYLYGIIIFVYMPTAMIEAHEMPCSTISQCFAYVIEVGLANSDISSGMAGINSQDPYYTLFWVLTVSYVILVSLVLLNVIFGIIIDSFAQLRTEQEEVAKMMINECFICLKERQVFEDPHIESNFQDHLDSEHNVWNYVCFIVYLASKSKTELTGTEQYVIEELEQDRFSWFPMNRALVTEDPSAEEENSATDQNRDDITRIIDDTIASKLPRSRDGRGDHEELLDYSSKQMEQVLRLLSKQQQQLTEQQQLLSEVMGQQGFRTSLVPGQTPRRAQQAGSSLPATPNFNQSHAQGGSSFPETPASRRSSRSNPATSQSQHHMGAPSNRFSRNA